MEEILISVVIPAYNCTQFIAQALDSVLIQDVPLEIIVVNDCSTDDLETVLEPYSHLPNFRCLHNEQRMGVAQTRNRGVAAARGRYIAFLDADDIWLEGKLKKQLRLIEETGSVICSTARELMIPDGTRTGYILPVRTKYTYEELRKQNHINCSSVLIKADVAREFPMHNDDGHEDYLMWLEVLKKYRSGCAVNEPLLLYRITNTGKSGNKWNSAKMTWRTYRHMGFGFFRTLLFFTCYAIHGIRKYFLWFLKK